MRSQTTAAHESGSKVDPRLPHEHDESSDSQAVGNLHAARKMHQAARDVSRGLVDTDLGPVLDGLNRKHFANTPQRRRRPR
jgi:hypothetical protein